MMRILSVFQMNSFRMEAQKEKGRPESLKDASRTGAGVISTPSSFIFSQTTPRLLFQHAVSIRILG